METKTYDGADGTRYAETKDAITITVTGAPLANLRAIADAMNAVGWCDDNNTAATILDEFIIGDYFANLGTPTKKVHGITVCGVGEITESLIVNGIDTGVDEGTDEDKKRRAALRASFDRFGV